MKGQRRELAAACHSPTGTLPRGVSSSHPRASSVPTARGWFPASQAPVRPVNGQCWWLWVIPRYSLRWWTRDNLHRVIKCSLAVTCTNAWVPQDRRAYCSYSATGKQASFWNAAGATRRFGLTVDDFTFVSYSSSMNTSASRSILFFLGFPPTTKLC
jgi:hypothetical protein